MQRFEHMIWCQLDLGGRADTERGNRYAAANGQLNDQLTPHSAT